MTPPIYLNSVHHINLYKKLSNSRIFLLEKMLIDTVWFGADL